MPNMMVGIGGLGYIKKLPMPIWDAAVDQVHHGTGNAVVFCMGDSLTACYNGTYSNTRPSSYPVALASLLGGVPGGWFGNAHVDANGFTLAQYDHRVAEGAGWNETTGEWFGGKTLNSGAGTGNLTFTPGTVFDRARIYYNSASSTGNLGVTDGTTAIIQPTSNATLQTTALNFNMTARAAGALTLHAQTSGDDIYIAGVDFWDSQTSQIRVIGAGAAGWKTADWLNAQYSAAMWNLIQPHLAIILINANDMSGGTSVSDFGTNLSAILDYVTPISDVILVKGPRADPAWALDSVQDTYAAKLDEVAAAYHCTVVDMNRHWGSFAAGNAAGLYSDIVHPSLAGYADLAAAIRGAITI